MKESNNLAMNSVQSALVASYYMWQSVLCFKLIVLYITHLTLEIYYF